MQPLTNFSYSLLTKDDKPTQNLQNILTFFGIQPTLSLTELIQETQKKWLRPSDNERWHLSETLSAAQRNNAHRLFEKIGMVYPITPSQKKYCYLLFMGGDIHGMHERLTELAMLLHKGVSISQIIFLTAQRELDPNHESIEKICSILGKENKIQCERAAYNLKTEYDLLKYMWHESPLAFQVKTSPSFINTPNKLKNGKLIRATTPDTIIEWLKQKPKPGSCLILSSQPLIGYQEAVARTLLSHNFPIDSYGPASSTTVTTAEYLDTLARWLYQEGILRKII